MFVVNFLGGFAVTPAVLRHHNCYCSYADTIMPQFLFAVGFAFRLTFGRRTHTQGLPAAYRRVARRLAALALLALVLYTLGAGTAPWDRLGERGLGGVLAELFKRHWFQTLLHIAVTSLWVLPVIRTGAAVRVAYLLFSAGVHVALSAWFNFAWVNTPPHGIDGGPLGFLTWAVPTLVGALACDAVRGGCSAGKMLAGSVLLMGLGYGLSCGTRLSDVPTDRGRDLASLLAEPPFVPPPGPAERRWNYWMMSQRSGSVSYQTFGAGFSLALFLLFYLICDRLGWRVGLFCALGTNALAAYVLHGLFLEALTPLVPRDDAGWCVAAGCAAFFAATYLSVWLLEKGGVVLRL